ncbi:hypothetical protein DFH08DRAFT_986416 [Mycena albidolilacea]|uniref:Uncharacterized protein n=1 Tax=Mycena albidolilacea TaxID=1033008 RepID=A0AAD6Z1J5_9AGAR|nr:hypothetical protein DFH08DRAFT_986416 [Mycena albidolilacea]
MRRQADAHGLQSSLKLDRALVQTNTDGQTPPIAPGQSPAMLSQNNFINFCALGLPQRPITNGLQNTAGSCNPIVAGEIPAVTKMPSTKFQSPTNGATITASTSFTVSVGAKNMQLGIFTNAASTYYANPQVLNAAGLIQGHMHLVIEAIPSEDSTAVPDPQQFVFFQSVATPADDNGVVHVNVTGGVPAGSYRMSTVLTAATHQPVLVPVGMHGSLDDMIYFTAA